MLLQIHEIYESVNNFILPFTRIAALFSVAPVIGGPFIPLRIKVAIATVITIFALPLLKTTNAIELFTLEGAIHIGMQLLIGLLMGFILRLVFGALIIAGENIAITMGLGFAQITDPVNGVSVPVVSQFLTVAATLIFLAFDGHLALINMVLNSFIYLPIGSSILQPDVFWSVAVWASNMFSGALAVAIPAVTALLITNTALALMTRAAPQLNIFSVGFPITILLGLTVIALTLPSMTTVFQKLLFSAFDQIPFAR